ncbi:ATP-binding protein [Oryzomonas japonica]|nr:ATP-binding protein [Oryzomonas japonica]
MRQRPALTITQFKTRVRLVVGLLLVVVIAISAWQMVSERHAIINAAEKQSEGYARALGEHAGSAFAEADRALQDIASEIDQRGGVERVDQRTLFHLIRRQGGDTPQIGAIFIVNRKGVMAVNSLEFPSRQINVADRDYFLSGKDNPNAGLFFSRPLVSRLSNCWRFTMTRPLVAADGSFSGLVAAAFEIDYFHRFYTSTSLGPRGKVLLIRTDGAPLVNEPFAENAYTTDFQQSALFRRYLPHAPAGTFRGSQSPLDTTPRIISYYRISRFPVVAVVSLHQGDFLDSWRQKAVFQATILAGLSLTILLLMHLLMNYLDRLQGTQNSLREEQEQVRLKAAQIDAANDAILLTDSEGHLLHVNTTLCHMTGFTQDELLRKNLRDLQTPEFMTCTDVHTATTLERGEAIFESAYLAKGGEVLPVEIHARAMTDDGKDLILSIVRDISERKRNELREHTRLRILEEMATGAGLADLLLHIVGFVEQECRGALCSILLLDEDEQHLRRGVAPSLPDFYNQAVDGQRPGQWLLSSGADGRRYRRMIVDDLAAHPSWRDFIPAREAGLRACWAEPVFSSEDELLGTVAMYYREPRAPDQFEIQMIETAAHLASIAIGRFKIEERRNHLEVQLHHVQKIEAIGQLAGGIAHDFNNLLTPILVYAEMMQNKLAKDDPQRSKTQGIISAACKARDLTQQLLSFGRKQMLTIQPVDLNGIVRMFQDILRRTIRESVSIDIRLAPGKVVILADRGQIEQVLLNLAVNAQDAITGNGTIIVETGHVVLDNEYARLHPGMRPGPYALLAFSDNGCGMDDETLVHIFEPFFTTKQVGHGTGLGLATVYGIIKQHEGYITVRSGSGEGTTFCLYLPLGHHETAIKELEPVAPTVAPGTPRGGSIMVVEDNDMVREMAVELLESSGYRVLVADHPAAARELARQNRSAIDLLVTDVVMPEMNGRDLYGYLHESLPKLRVLYISGYANELFVHDGLLEEGIDFLQKPFTAERFLERVRQALE